MRWVLMAAMAAASAQSWTPPLRALDRGPQSLVATARLAVARDESEWARLWNAHAPERARPGVDFATEMVVGVFAGTRPVAGYGVEIAGWREAAGIVVVGFRETAPAPGLVSAQVITSPFAIAAIPRRSGEVTFERIDGR